jgi:hypothetical protein
MVSKQRAGRCVDLVYIDPPFNSNRNYEVFWGETKLAHLSGSPGGRRANLLHSPTIHALEHDWIAIEQ